MQRKVVSRRRCRLSVANVGKIGTQVLAFSHVLDDIVVEIDTKFVIAGLSNQRGVDDVEWVEIDLLRDDTDQLGGRSLIDIACAIEAVWG